jgi:hypothetical protein
MRAGAKFQFQKSAHNQTAAPKVISRPVTPMTKTSTKKRANKKAVATTLATAAVVKKRLSLGSNTSTRNPQKRTRKKNVSHQQTIQARDTLDAEYHDWRTNVSRLHPFFPLPSITTIPLFCFCLHVLSIYIYLSDIESFSRRAHSRLMASLADNKRNAGSATS